MHEDLLLATHHWDNGLRYDIYFIWIFLSNSHYYHFLSFGGILFFELQVVKGKVEEVELPEKADILISEPMGKLLSSCFTSFLNFAREVFRPLSIYWICIYYSG